jgi:hypothetical protein
MLHVLKRHPIPIEAWFRHCLVLTYALPESTLAPLLPRGLVLDTCRGHGFLAIAMVQTRSLRPAGLPASLGCDFFLTGYRVFARYRTAAGRTLRGLRILRSDADRSLMVLGGNLLTHYNYRKCRVVQTETAASVALSVRTPLSEADLDVEADLREGAALPEGSPFRDWREGRRFAGPLPFTFDHEARTDSIVRIRGVRQHWDPRPVRAAVTRATFLNRFPAQPILASAFHTANIPYRWERGIAEPIPEAAA